MLSQSKVAIVRALLRRNSSPIFCAMVPQVPSPPPYFFVLKLMLVQEEKVDEDGWNEPPGFHLIPLPYADDLRAAPIDRAERGTCPHIRTNSNSN